MVREKLFGKLGFKLINGFVLVSKFLIIFEYLKVVYVIIK